MKKRILFIHHSGGLGGAPRSLNYLLRSIERNKYVPLLINIEDGPANILFSKSRINPVLVKHCRPFHGTEGVNLTLKLIIRNWVYFIPSIINARKHIRKLQPDLIHLNSTSLISFAIAAKLVNKKLPVICHVREVIKKGFLGWPLRFFLKRNVDGFIGIYKYGLDSLKIPRENIKIRQEVIYNFVDVDPMKISEQKNLYRDKLMIKKEDIVFLYLARFSAANGWRELYDMAEVIIKEKQNYHFILAGAENINNLKINKSTNIHILPFQNKVGQLLQTADIFVCPFTQPHFARGIIEASAFGLPILASNIEGVNELVKQKKTGYLYDNQISFKNYAIKLGDNPKLRKELGNNGIKFAKMNFNFETNTKKTFDFYKYFENDF